MEIFKETKNINHIGGKRMWIFERLIIATGITGFIWTILSPIVIANLKRENCYCFWEKVFTEQVASEDLKELWEEKVDFGKIYDYSEDNKTGFILEIPNGIIKIIGEIGKKVVVICKDNKVKVYNLSLPKNCNLYDAMVGKWLKEKPIPTFIPSANYTYILFCVNKM